MVLRALQDIAHTSLFVAIASALAAFYSFLTPIIARRQGQKAKLPDDRRVDFDRMLSAMDREDERKAREIARLEKTIIDERKRSNQLEDDLYEANRKLAQLEGTIYRAGWRKNEAGEWGPNGVRK